MIVVDSSVWIDFFPGAVTPEVTFLNEAMRRPAVIVGDLVLCEVLKGAASDRQAALLQTELSRFQVVPMARQDLAVTAAAHFRALRARGITVRKTIDLLIGTFCIEENLPLLHRDRDFDAMEQHLGLRVLHA